MDRNRKIIIFCTSLFSSLLFFGCTNDNKEVSTENQQRVNRLGIDSLLLVNEIEIGDTVGYEMTFPTTRNPNIRVVKFENLNNNGRIKDEKIIYPNKDTVRVFSKVYSGHRYFAVDDSLSECITSDVLYLRKEKVKAEYRYYGGTESAQYGETVTENQYYNYLNSFKKNN